MAHELDGKWNIFIIEDESGNVVVNGSEPFILKHDASNRLEKGSVHGTQDLTGSSVPDGKGGFDINISEELKNGKHRTYLGKVLENNPGGKDRKVIGGLRQKATLMAVKKQMVAGQTDGVWVGTQP